MPVAPFHVALPNPAGILKVGRGTLISQRQQEANRRHAAKSHGLKLTLQLAKRPIFRHYEVRMCGTLA